MIADVVAEAAIAKFVTEHPEFRRAEVPAPLKWVAVIISGLFTVGIATGLFWMVSSISEMRETLARMDERMISGAVKDSRVDYIERRVTALELKESTDQ